MKDERTMGPPTLLLVCRVLLLAATLILLPLLTGTARAAESVPTGYSAGKVLSNLEQAMDFTKRMRPSESKQNAGAARTLIPLGHTVGIKLFSDGVMVVGISDIPTSEGDKSPAAACGLHEGDIITHLNGKQVHSIEEVKAMLQELCGAPMTVRVQRGERQVQLNVSPVQCAQDGSYKLGAWIRDSMGGIGTVTFYDPSSGVFGALGHGIMDVDTMLLMPLKSGAVMHSTVTEVTRGESGAPGQLHGKFCLTAELGSLYANTDCGIFGTMEPNALTAGREAMPIASRGEVQVGKAYIMTNIAGDEVGQYEVQIERVYPEAGQISRNLLLKVTDERLLKATGGIVQGMSGSPILQNGKVVGAVTHVLVSDPTSGYGIFIDNMLEEAYLSEQQNAS